jgi:transposase-like protein
VLARDVRTYLWRAVDAEGEILDVLMQSKRDKRAALRLMRNLRKKQGMAPAKLVTDRLSAYLAAARELGLSAEHVQGKRKNNRAEARTCRSDGASARCRASAPLVAPNASLPSMLPSPLPSPPAAT